MTESLPLRLHRAASILARSEEPGAREAVAAVAEVAARIVVLEAALDQAGVAAERVSVLA